MNTADLALQSDVERSDKEKDPVVGSTGSSKEVQQMNNRSGRLRCCLLSYALCLRAFLSLNNFEFNVIALLEALVSLRLDGTVVDEHIRAVISANKAEALSVVEPFHFTFNSRHVPYSGLSLGTQANCGPRTSFFSWVCHSFWEGTQKHRRFNLLPVLHVLYPYFGFGLILPSSAGDVNSIYVLKKQWVSPNKTSCTCTLNV